jgi:mannose-1-phosphate guanylyltransferase/phosphomannomutase
MLPIMGKPALLHIINLLKKHGITNIIITLQYLPQVVIDYFGDGRDFGVNIEYFIERVPLGTAGSVKNAQSSLSDTFLVISGDSVTDIDLTRALDYHSTKNADATLVLTTVDKPYEYGVVETESDGHINKFLEKPDWTEVWTNTVNTGTYILKKSVLNKFSANEMFDFASDLFPMMLSDGDEIYGYTAAGYWCDIGDAKAYAMCHNDILDGKIVLDIDADYTSVDSSKANIHKDAIVGSPCYIGEGVKVGAGAYVSAYSVLGDNCKVGDNARVNSSIFHDRVTVGASTSISNSIVCQNSKIGDFTTLHDASIIGANCVVDDMVTVHPSIKIWSNKHIEQGANVHSNLVWGDHYTRKLFGDDAIVGEVNVDITPEFATRLGTTFSALFKGGHIGIGYGSGGALLMLKNAFIAGLLSSGAEVYDFDVQTLPTARNAIAFYKLDGGVHLAYNPDDEKPKLTISFLDSNGGNIVRAKERKLEQMFNREDYTRAEAEEIANVNKLTDYNLFYLHRLLNYDDTAKQIDRMRMPISVECNNKVACELANTVLKKIGAGVYTSADEVNNMVTAHIDDLGENVVLYDEKGHKLTSQQYLYLQCKMILEWDKAQKIVVPMTASNWIDDLAARHGAEVLRSKITKSDIQQTLLQNKLDYQFKLMFDANFMLLQLCRYMNINRMKLWDIVSTLPTMYFASKEIEVDDEVKSQVLGNLARRVDGIFDSSELNGGLKLARDNGWVMVSPVKHTNKFKVVAEGATQEIADELTGMI